MSDHLNERVLVVPTVVLHQLGLFHGFSPDVERYLPHLLDSDQLRYLPRAEAEHDPSYKQLIPYAVLRCGELIFHYTRVGGGEMRLRARRSIGIGGHISSDDGAASSDAYRMGMLRELEEEVIVESAFRERCIGLINDDRTPVGQVHLGIVHLIDLDAPQVRAREASLAEVGFATLSQLRAEGEKFETWSQFLLEGNWLGE